MFEVSKQIKSTLKYLRRCLSIHFNLRQLCNLFKKQLKWNKIKNYNFEKEQRDLLSK